MTLHARMSPSDNRWYNPNRDLAHCWKQVVTETAARLEDGKLALVDEWCKDKGVTLEELGQACGVFCHFVAGAADQPESMAGCLRRHGWFELSPAAQFAFMATLGTVVTGMFYAGAKESTIGGQGPCLTYQDLRQAGQQTSVLMGMPRWRRRLYFLRGRLAKVWRTLLGRAEDIA